MNNERRKVAANDSLPLLKVLEPKRLTEQLKVVKPVTSKTVLSDRKTLEQEVPVDSVLALVGDEVVSFDVVLATYKNEDEKLGTALTKCQSCTDIFQAFLMHSMGCFLDALQFCPNGGELERLARLVASYAQETHRFTEIELKIPSSTLKKRACQIYNSTPLSLNEEVGQ